MSEGQPSEVTRQPWIDEVAKRRPGWTPGCLFVGGDGCAWAMPVIDDALIGNCPQLRKALEAASRGTHTSDGWLGGDELFDRAAVALILIQYDLDSGELVRVLATEPKGRAGTSPEGIAMMLGWSKGLRAGRVTLAEAKGDESNDRGPEWQPRH